MRDEAWIKDDGKTNKKLKDGDRVMLIHSVVEDMAAPPEYRRLIEKGAVGIVAYAMTPRVRNEGYFANVDMDCGTRVRVPHNALKIINRSEA